MGPARRENRVGLLRDQGHPRRHQRRGRRWRTSPQLCGTIVIGEDDSKTVRIVPPEVIRALPDWRALVLRMNLSPVIVKFRPAWKRLDYRFGRRVPVYVPRQQDARTLEREPAPAEVAPALSEADLARFFDQADPAPGPRSRCRPARTRAPSSAEKPSS